MNKSFGEYNDIVRDEIDTSLDTSQEKENINLDDYQLSLDTHREISGVLNENIKEYVQSLDTNEVESHLNLKRTASLQCETFQESSRQGDRYK